MRYERWVSHRCLTRNEQLVSHRWLTRWKSCDSQTKPYLKYFFWNLISIKFSQTIQYCLSKFFQAIRTCCTDCDTIHEMCRTICGSSYCGYVCKWRGSIRSVAIRVLASWDFPDHRGFFILFIFSMGFYVNPHKYSFFCQNTMVKMADSSFQ